MAQGCDIFVIGGGINGCGIARDAAGRGYDVCLAEMDDLASGTSSGSTKLVHGGLRYLEFFEFRLVREALMERERLWANAPHIIWPLRFVLPHHSGLRPAWMLRLGLFMYDHLGGRKNLPATRTVDLANGPLGEPLKQDYQRGFEYSDCWVDDARLVVLNARDAENRGAEILVRHKVVGLKPSGDGWQVTVRDAEGGERTIAARCVINAAGPWVDEVLRGAAGRNGAHNVRLVKGSHVVVPKIYEHDRCYIFQNADGRILFAIPYEDDFTLLGTTDRDFEGDPADAAISDDEAAYICNAASEYFRKPVEAGDAVWTYSAVRPLYDDGASKAQEATRDYVIARDEQAASPLFNVFGGKITTYRRLAESMLEQVEDVIGARGRPWTRDAALPGGDMPLDGQAQLADELSRIFPWLAREIIARMVRQYGTDTRQMLSNAKSLGDLGEEFGAGLYAREVEWLVTNEWARTAEDILWRRTKLGLRFSASETARLEKFVHNAVKELSAPGKEPGRRKAGDAAA
ncbi:glycerol-3-phosphate dehydrogenase [Tepidamorphus sp. 3E244]|uniref:glycerol-3-phosphate dehydrogenase n=1 Tax=Tepidamorphus sp. 3E244 TaxID=3385498 RepID=UPI0038FCCD37